MNTDVLDPPGVPADAVLRGMRPEDVVRSPFFRLLPDEKRREYGAAMLAGWPAELSDDDLAAGREVLRAIDDRRAGYRQLFQDLLWATDDAQDGPARQ